MKPDSGLNRSKYREDGKFVLIPFASVVAVKDYIVVDENRATKSMKQMLFRASSLFHSISIPSPLFFHLRSVSHNSPVPRKA